MIFKQLLQAEAIDVVQIDSCRLAGVSEVLSVLLMAAKLDGSTFLSFLDRMPDAAIRLGLASPFARMPAVLAFANMSSISGMMHYRLTNRPLLFELTRLSSLIDYIAVSGTWERNVLE